MTNLLHRLNRAMAAWTGRVLMRAEDLHAWQLRPRFGGSFNPGILPTGAADWLRPNNPRLAELRERYRAMDPRVTTPLVWTEARVKADDLAYFRGDNNFVWQVRGPRGNELSYALTYYHAKAGDREGLLDLLDEDDSFGIHLFEIDGRNVSRDLLDSLGEISFLRRHAGIGAGPCSILDIGAGYGRLAHRLHQATGEDVRIFATDAYAPSTFVAEYYLRHRRAERASVVPLDEVDAMFARERIDVAVNIHSFSECTPEAVAWWAEKLAAHRVPRLMVVPNEGRSPAGISGSAEDCRGLAPIFARCGYRETQREPRYDDPLVAKYGVDPSILYLFELR
ncbi:MAG: hypothetical protein JWO81_2233 [Alphaproteobacteria bacterium]|nr:hypothetical protein [Alphaproteobacteria bacterium]